MSDEGRNAPRRELIEANHSFPGPYLIKAFGPGEGDFAARVRALAGEAVPSERLEFSHRPSRSGRRVCVTVGLDAQDVEEVIALYEALAALEDLALLL